MERYRFLVENANSREASKSPIAFFFPIVFIVFSKSIVSNFHIFLSRIFFVSTKLQNVARFVRLTRIKNCTYRGMYFIVALMKIVTTNLTYSEKVTFESRVSS